MTTSRHGRGEARRAERALLVTGGAGFIGSHFVEQWGAAHPHDRVVVLDALTYAGRRAWLAAPEARGAIVFVHGDVTDAALVRDVMHTHAITHVVHFAAESHVDRSIATPDPFVRTNVWGTHVLLEAARACWSLDGSVRPEVRFHHVSTDEVYGALAPGAPAFTEETAYRPSSPYSASKAAADHLVRAAGRTYGLPWSITHSANNYGPRQYPEKLIPSMVRRALRGEPMPLYGDGQQTREWLHVHDHNAMLASVLLAPDMAGQSVNLGTAVERTNLDVVTMVCDALDAWFADAAHHALAARFASCPAARGTSCRSLITHVADRPGHDRRYALDASLYARRFGPPPTRLFEEGLRETVRWAVAHDGWWDDR